LREQFEYASRDDFERIFGTDACKQAGVVLLDNATTLTNWAEDLDADDANTLCKYMAMPPRNEEPVKWASTSIALSAKEVEDLSAEYAKSATR
jgi:hypothetical protein